MKPPALIVIDMQEGFLDPYWGSRNNVHLEKNVIQLLAEWREKSWPIFHVQHLSREPQSPLHPSKPGVVWMDCVIPRDGERVIQKDVNSCFIGTNLESILRQQGIERLAFVGIASDHCVSTSVRMASNLGFECFIFSDATTSFDRKGPGGEIYSAQLIHQTSLASLHGEFATVLNTDQWFQLAR